MDKLACMRAFVAVVDASGFSSAAKKSGNTKAMFSKHVAHLESELGSRLLQRTTRHVTPTEIGRAYYDRCLPILEDIDELESVVRDAHETPVGELRISAPTSFAELHLMQVVSSFADKYPRISVNMILTDKLVDIVEDRIDLALRIGNLPDSSLIARKLGSIRTIACASPDYLTQYGEPVVPKDLLNHHCIVDTNIQGGSRWNFHARTHEKKSLEESISVTAKYSVNSATAIRALALSHCGIALSPDFMVDRDIVDKRLRIVLPQYDIQTFGLYAVYSHRRHLSAKVRLFVEQMRVHFGVTPTWDTTGL